MFQNETKDQSGSKGQYKSENGWHIFQYNKPKQQPETELLLFKLTHSSTFPSKNNMNITKKYRKNKCVCFNEVIWLMTTKMRLKMKGRSQRYDIRYDTKMQRYDTKIWHI